MTGQPNGLQNITGWLIFDVTKLEPAEPTGALMPANIVPVNSAFDLIATFTGSGFVWGWLTNLNAVGYQVNFFAEGFGPTTPDFDLGTVTGTLLPGQTTYQVILSLPAGINMEGYYEIACLVTFPQCPEMSGHIDPPIYFQVTPP